MYQLLEFWRELFRLNEIIIYFLYGQAFFIMGVAIGLKFFRQSQLTLARHLPMLAAFGFAHGLTEWGYVFIPIQAGYVPETVIELLQFGQIVLMISSFLFLLLFGVRIALPIRPHRSWPRIVPFLAMAAWAYPVAHGVLWSGLSWSQVLTTAELWGRYLLAFPGSILAAIGLFGQAREQWEAGLPRIAAYLRAAAVVFLCYAFVGGLTTTTDAMAPARWLNADVVREALGIPMPVFRSVLGIGMAYTIIRALEVFRIEVDRRLETAERARFEVAERSRRALSGLAFTLSRPLDIQHLLDAALEEVLRVMGLRVGWILVAEPISGELHLGTSAGVPSPTYYSCIDRTPRRRCACSEPFTNGEIAAGEASHVCPVLSGCVDVALTWHISVPLRSKDHVLGTINLAGGPEHKLIQEDRELLTAIGTEIGVAIENVRLWEELRKKEALRAQLLERLINAQEEERKRIARDLHDEAGQALSAIGISISTAQGLLPRSAKRSAKILSDTVELTANTLQGIRRMIVDLRPSALDDLGLVSGLRRYADAQSERSGISIRVQADGMRSRLPPEIETVLFRIVQEALTNVVRHSRAQVASVSIQFDDSELRATIDDDGQGFDIAALGPEPEAALGLMGMQERAALVGGTLKVESARGQGTRVFVSLPIGEAAV